MRTKRAFSRSTLLAGFGEEKTLAEWKKDPRRSVSTSAVNRRLARGWPLERALTSPAKDHAAREELGERKLLSEWVKDPRCVVSLATLRARVARGERLEEALTRPPWKFGSTRVRTGKLWPAFGKALTVNQWVDDPVCLVSVEVLHSRFLKGMKPEAALTTPPRKSERLHKAFDEVKSLAAWARDPRSVVPYSTICQRMDRGWDFVSAITTPRKSPGPVNQANRRRRKPCSVLPHGDDVPLEALDESKTLREWAEDWRCEVPYSRLRIRLKRGWSLEEAILRAPAVGNRDHKAHGVWKSLYAWEKDPRCLVAARTLQYRMKHGETLEEAMSRPPHPGKSLPRPANGKIT